MKMISARQVWHDAYDPQLKSITLEPTGGQGNTSQVINQVQKGLIQSVIQGIRDRDVVAYTWGMMAYTPIMSHIRPGKGPVYEWLEASVYRRFTGLEADKQTRIKLHVLMFPAIRDAIAEDLGAPRKRREFRHLGNLVKTDAETYRRRWHKVYLFMRDRCLDLPERALPPVAHFIEVWKTRHNQDVRHELNQILYGRTG